MEYEKLKAKIIAHMKKTGKNGSEYGEFFPPSIAPVCYNETQGNYYMPLTREEVLAKGWLWEEKIPGTFGKETVASEKMPDDVVSVENNITAEILKCVVCEKNYNIVPDEINFYKKENVPLPRLCPTCRYKRRFALQLPRKLWQRKCMCENQDHNHGESCDVEFETPYAPDRPEKVYCENCYNQEIY